MRPLFWLAILPSLLLARRVLAYDRIEREPARLLARLFALGMLTCLPASLIEGVGDVPLMAASASKGMYSALTYLVLVPLAEEGVKYLALRTTHDHPAFNYTFDGIVYAVMVALGFATLENLLYVLEYQSLQTAVMRGLFSVPLHCTCGVFMGYFYGVARGQEARGEQGEARRARRLALVVPWAIHGLYDYSLDTQSGLALAAGFVFTLVVFALASRQVRLASAHDEPIMVSLSQQVLDMAELPLLERHEWRNKGAAPPPFNR